MLLKCVNRLWMHISLSTQNHIPKYSFVFFISISFYYKGSYLILFLWHLLFLRMHCWLFSIDLRLKLNPLYDCLFSRIDTVAPNEIKFCLLFESSTNTDNWSFSLHWTLYNMHKFRYLFIYFFFLNINTTRTLSNFWWFYYLNINFRSLSF